MATSVTDLIFTSDFHRCSEQLTERAGNYISDAFSVGSEDFVWSSGRDIMGWQQSTDSTTLETTDVICTINRFYLQPRNFSENK